VWGKLVLKFFKYAPSYVGELATPMEILVQRLRLIHFQSACASCPAA